MTINEPNIHAIILAMESGALAKNFLPSPKPEGVVGLKKVHHVAVRAVKSLAPELKVGWGVANLKIYPSQPEFVDATKEISWDYEDQYIAESTNDNYISIQSYSHSPVDGKVGIAREDDVRKTQMGYAFYPAADSTALRRVHEIQPKLPLIVSENGMGTEEDNERSEYINSAMDALEDVLADGIDVRGYCHWSLLDNFEWSLGYGPKFGLVSVDHKTFKRTVKPSALVYRDRVAKFRQG